MNIYRKVFLILAITVFSVFSKDIKVFKTKFEAAQALFKDSSYSDALPIYLELYKLDSTNANINYKVGVCYLKGGQARAKAARYLEKAVVAASADYKEDSFEERKAPLDAYYYLGDAHHFNYQFDGAIVNYEKFKTNANVSRPLTELGLKDVDRKIQISKNAKVLEKNPIRLKIESLGKNINSPYGDYAPVLTADQATLIFTSRRPETTGGGKFSGGLYFEDIYIATKQDSTWGQAVNIGSPINTNSNEASVGVSLDGQTIFIYKDDNGDGNIYVTHLQGDKWSAPEKLNENINTKSKEPSAWLSPNGNTLFFSSDRKGGFGGMDLYKSDKTPEGDWGKAVNLGPDVNTEYDEDAPFIHPDGVTLFFSSNGHQTMGGFDIFYTTLTNNDAWTSPVNVGYPVNSTDDDIFYVVSPDNKKAYYTSLRAGGYGDEDNYIITFLEQKNASIALLRGTVLDESGKALPDVKITVTDNATHKVVGSYRANSKTGNYLFVLTGGKNYNVAYEAKGFLFYSYNVYVPLKTNYFELVKTVQLPRIVVGSVVVLENIFFEENKAVLTAESTPELDYVTKFLNANPRLMVQISGYTDSKGEKAYNKKLSMDRAKVVVDALVLRGIAAKRVIAKGYGEESPTVPNEKPDGTDNPVGRQLNRRVDLRIIQVN